MEGGAEGSCGVVHLIALSTPTGVEVDLGLRLCLGCYNIEVHMKWLISEYALIFNFVGPRFDFNNFSCFG
jgi:hypothetical protein